MYAYSIANLPSPQSLTEKHIRLCFGHKAGAGADAFSVLLAAASLKGKYGEHSRCRHSVK
jgi:hypothetical protein